MGDRQDVLIQATATPTEDISQFADSYASFNRVINTLQRKYIELKDEFSAQNDKLVETNRRLIEMTSRNLAATEFLDNILNSISAGVIAVDQDGHVTSFNPAASLMLGIPLRDPLGKPYRDVIPPGDRFDANALRAAETGRSVADIEKVLELPDGTRLVVSVSTAILKDKNGRANGAVEVFYDLTKTKKMEQEIARLNTLAALGEMAAQVAHQVRNPLSGILGYGSLLKRDIPGDDPCQKLVSKITDGVETLNRTVTTLLDYTKNEEVNREQVVFDDYIYNVVQHFKRDNVDLAEAMDFHIQAPDRPEAAPISVWIDPVLYREVLFNLFTNACEACCTEGRISMVYRKLPRQRATEKYGDRLLLGLDETVFELRVTDSGPGIDDETLAQIFAPFFTTKNGGNGLGLAVGWKIMKAHGGEIIAERSSSGGAQFALLLPVKIGQVEELETTAVSGMETN